MKGGAGLFELSDKNCMNTLPEALARRYRSADGPSLKVALWLMCAGSGEALEIADSLAIPLETVERALALWLAEGLIIESGVASEGAARPKAKKRQPPMMSKRLSDERAAELALCDGNVAALLQETQALIRRPLDNAESRALLELYECEELPVEVILTVVAFCEPRLKNKRSLISGVRRHAAAWADEGVRDAESAARHVKLLETRERREKEVAEALGYVEEDPFTKPQRAMIARWYEDYGYNADFAREAFERTGNDSVAYINAILKSWYKKGYTSIKDTYAEGFNAKETPSRERAAVNAARRESPHEVSRGENSLFETAIREINAKG